MRTSLKDSLAGLYRYDGTSGLTVMVLLGVVSSAGRLGPCLPDVALAEELTFIQVQWEVLLILMSVT